MLLLSVVFALAGLVLGLFLLVPWPTSIDADELDFGQNSGAMSGSEIFSRLVPRDDRAYIGKVPVGIKDLSINLTVSFDLDIELWDGDVFVVGWLVNGKKSLIYHRSPISGLYRGVKIYWSGSNSVNGTEYTRISGTTQNSYLMKVFGYQEGDVSVEYRWGLGLASPLPEPKPTPTPTPTPTTTPDPTPKPEIQTVKTWVGGEQEPWDERLNWSPIGLPSGDEIIIIKLKGLNPRHNFPS